MSLHHRRARAAIGAALGVALLAGTAACSTEADSAATDAGSTDSGESAGSAGSEESQTPSDAAGDEPSSSPEAEAGAAWLAGQLDQGLLSYTSQYGPFTDVGMSIDAALALSRVGGHDQEVDRIAAAVAKQLPTYTSYPVGKETHVLAGSLAKAMVLAEETGQDPGDFGGTDLQADLEERVLETGRISDAYDPKNKQDADYANVIGQVFAARALSGADSERADAVVDHLLEQQCEEGWFRQTFTADPQAEDQTCDGDPKASADPDVTALAAIHLTEVAAGDDEVATALDDALGWLADQQADDGSVSGAAPAVANTNTTGLAGWAFTEHDRDQEAAAAATWVGEHQLADGPDAGAVAFDEKALAAAPKGRIKEKQLSQWLLATAQALPALLRLG
jgi:hypothetical protein